MMGESRGEYERRLQDKLARRQKRIDEGDPSHSSLKINKRNYFKSMEMNMENQSHEDQSHLH